MAEAINEGKALREQEGEDIQEGGNEEDSQEKAPAGDISDEEKEALIKESVEEEEKEKPKAKETKATEKKTEAKETKPKSPAKSSGSKGDDLTKLPGVGKVYAAKLNDMGIKSFEDVANVNDEQLDKIENEHKFKGDFKDVIAEAKKLVG
jgi:predicted flap endonuclease-1-like 5' DNA nuclease